MPDNEIPLPEDTLANMESQLRDVSERAEAMDEVERSSQERAVHSTLHQVLPDRVMKSFEPKDQTIDQSTELEMGLDGNPIVRTWGDAQMVYESRPDIAAKVSEEVKSLTIVNEQQLEIDIARAVESGDQEEVAKLTTKKLDQEEKKRGIQFFCVVAALHPMSAEFKDEAFGKASFENTIYSHVSIGDYSSQVEFLLMLDKLYNRLRSRLDANSSTDIRQMKQSAAEAKDSVWADYANFQEDRSGQAAVEYNSLKNILEKIAIGEASLGTPPTPHPADTRPETQDSEQKQQVKQIYDTLAAIPGRDLVTEALNGRYDELPQTGWIIKSQIEPGRMGQIKIHRVNDGGYRLRSYGTQTTRLKELPLELSSRYSGSTEFYYQNRPPYDQDPTSYDEISATNGRSIFIRREPVYATTDRAITSSEVLGSTDLEQSFKTWSEWSKISFNRITDDPDQARQIIIQLCEAMGMPVTGAKNIEKSLVEKDAFSESLKQDTRH
ncbi:MAG: hypothetical protein WCO19_00325 [Candidatus Saccharibacteria bacterium]